MKKLTEFINDDENNLLIMDGLNFSFRYRFSGKLQFANDFITCARSFANSYSAKKIIILGDGGSEYRKEIYDGYKSDRKEKYKDQTEEEYESFMQFLDEFNNTLELAEEYGILTLKYKGLEADDIAAYLCKEYKNNFDRVILISSDADWHLMINDKVSQFSYRNRKEYTKDGWKEHYDYPLEKHIAIKCLQGDKSDSIPGIEGIGPKRATTIMDTYNTLEDLINSLPLKGKAKYIQNLNNGKEILERNIKLMDLNKYCEAAIAAAGIEILEDINNRVQEFI